MVRLNKRRRSRSNRRSKRRNRNQRGGNWFNPMSWFGEKKEEAEDTRSTMGGVDSMGTPSSTDTEYGEGHSVGSPPSQFGGRRRRKSRRRRKKSRKSRKKKNRRTKRKRRR
tara:strand:- start:951 stop:1283 length:333 start_codon:yes stop_codon:yes gene_type:complete